MTSLAVQKQESRRYPRYPVSLMGSLLKDDWAREQVLGESDVFDLSVKGCQIFTETALEEGKFVGFRLFIPGEEVPVRVDLASVRWSMGGQSGLEFMVMRYKEEERLTEFLRTLR